MGTRVDRHAQTPRPHGRLPESPHSTCSKKYRQGSLLWAPCCWNSAASAREAWLHSLAEATAENEAQNAFTEITSGRQALAAGAFCK